MPTILKTTKGRLRTTRRRQREPHDAAAPPPVSSRMIRLLERTWFVFLGGGSFAAALLGRPECREEEDARRCGMAPRQDIILYLA